MSEERLNVARSQQWLPRI